MKRHVFLVKKNVNGAFGALKQRLQFEFWMLFVISCRKSSPAARKSASEVTGESALLKERIVI